MSPRATYRRLALDEIASAKEALDAAGRFAREAGFEDSELADIADASIAVGELSSKFKGTEATCRNRS